VLLTGRFRCRCRRGPRHCCGERDARSAACCQAVSTLRKEQTGCSLTAALSKDETPKNFNAGLGVSEGRRSMVRTPGARGDRHRRPRQVERSRGRPPREAALIRGGQGARCVEHANIFCCWLQRETNAVDVSATRVLLFVFGFFHPVPVHQ